MRLQGLVVLSAIFLITSCCPALVSGQDSPGCVWNTTTLSESSFAVVAIDVQRIRAGQKETASNERLIKFLEETKGLDLELLDQAQAIFGGEKPVTGSDDTTHTKIVYLEPVKLDPEIVGKMTGHELKKKKLLGKICYLGERDSHWSGVSIDEKTVAFAVPRKIPEVIGLAETSSPLLDSLVKIPSRSDVMITFVGGARSASLAEEFLWPQPLVELVSDAKSGTVIANFREDTVLSAQLQFESSEVAEKHSQSLQKLVADAAQFINQANGEDAINKLRKRVEELRKTDPSFPPEILENRLNEANAMNSFVPFLQELSVVAEGKMIRVTYDHPNGSPKILKAIIDIFSASLR